MYTYTYVYIHVYKLYVQYFSCAGTFDIIAYTRAVNQIMMSSHSNNLIFFFLGGGKMHILSPQSLFFLGGGSCPRCPPLLASMHGRRYKGFKFVYRPPIGLMFTSGSWLHKTLVFGFWLRRTKSNIPMFTRCDSEIRRGVYFT